MKILLWKWREEIFDFKVYLCENRTCQRIDTLARSNPLAPICAVSGLVPTQHARFRSSTSIELAYCMDSRSVARPLHMRDFAISGCGGHWPNPVDFTRRLDVGPSAWKACIRYTLVNWKTLSLDDLIPIAMINFFAIPRRIIIGLNLTWNEGWCVSPSPMEYLGIPSFSYLEQVRGQFSQRKNLFFSILSWVSPTRYPKQRRFLLSQDVGFWVERNAQPSDPGRWECDINRG